jgi:outer membrane beta-barrel protein
METRIRVVLLTTLTLALTGCGSLPFLGDEDAADDALAEMPEQVIEPEVERRDVRPPKIDTEDFEVGVFTGLMSVEDFGVSPVYGLRFAYHISEGLFVEAAIGRTDTEETSYERLSGAAEILTDDEREFTYYNASLGYNVLPGEAFVGRDLAFSQALYLIAGIGSTDFAGDDRFTVNFGFGYRLLLNDAIALHADVRDHLFDIDILGEEKTAHNIEGHIGFTVFF